MRDRGRSSQSHNEICAQPTQEIEGLKVSVTEKSMCPLYRKAVELGMRSIRRPFTLLLIEMERRAPL